MIKKSWVIQRAIVGLAFAITITLSPILAIAIIAFDAWLQMSLALTGWSPLEGACRQDPLGH